jgi:hypothetical protein
MRQIWPTADTESPGYIDGSRNSRNLLLGKTHRTFVTQLHTARKQFLRLWHEGEQPSRIWGRDCFGIEGYDRKESITSITLGQRKRKARQRKPDNGNG